ncbi:MAG: hypothetical protein Q8M92_08800, partial [Candidatus Subteraquimicrobiales bacterium]|nr:hypothetical protein [Candidatus Subteraquimicrobiales bacterium]
MIQRYTTFILDKFFIYLLLLFFALSCLPYITQYTEEIAYVAVVNEDEYDVFRNLERILKPSDYSFVEYLKLFTEDLSGSIWWAFVALVALPFKLIGSEQGMIISVRVMALLLPTLGTFYLSYRILRDFAKGWLLMSLLYTCLAFSFYTIVNIKSVSLTFPEPVYGFFLMLSFYFLYKADNQFNRYFYYSIMAYGASVSVKMLGLLYGIVYVIYLIKNWRKLNIPLVIKTIALWTVTLLFLNLILLHPEVRKFFLDNLKEAAFIGKSGFIQYEWFKDYPSSLGLFSSNYVNIYAFTLI